MAHVICAPQTVTKFDSAPTLPQWEPRTVGTGEREFFISVGEVFAGAAVLDIVFEPDCPGVRWPSVMLITRGRPDKVTRYIIAAVDRFDIDLDATISAALAEAADMILKPLGPPENTGLYELSDAQLNEMVDALAVVEVTGEH